MNELIKIEENVQGQNVVSARNLHIFLGVTERFQSWCTRNFEYGFDENEDFTSVKTFTVVNNGAKKEIQDYALTLDCAKEISMLQRNAKGKEARKYFIQAEKQFRQLQLHSYQIEDPVKRAEKWIEEQKEKQALEQNNLLLEANNQELEIELDEHKAWYSVKRVCLLGHFKTSEAKSLWRKLKTYSIVNNYKIVSIFDANYGSVKTYHKDVWKAVYKINL